MARIALDDLNTMELELLFAIDFQLAVSLEEYTAHTQALPLPPARPPTCSLSPAS